MDEKEISKLKENLSRTYEERFLMLMKLIKIDRMLKSAKIEHSIPPTSSNLE